MTKLSHRLQTIEPKLPALLDKQQSTWTFSKALSTQPPAFYDTLTRHSQTLNLEYDVLKVQLNQSLTDKEPNIPLLKRQLMAALAYSEVLEHANWLTHDHYAQKGLNCEQAIYHFYLRKMGIHFFYSKDAIVHAYEHSLSDNVRGTTALTNWPRLMVVRIKRILDTMVPLMKSMPSFCWMVDVIDAVANPIFAYLSWLFYAPRLCINTFNILKNTIPSPFMYDHQKQLPWTTRLSVQWQKLWFEWMNDAVWMTVGLVNCFVLVGALAPAAIYLTVSLYIFDVLLAAVRAHIEINRFHTIRKDYETMMFAEDNHTRAQEELRVYRAFLDEHIHYEKQRLYLSVATTSALFIGMCFALPMLAISPIIPLIGACFVVATCITTYWIGKNIERAKPTSTLKEGNPNIALHNTSDNKDPLKKHKSMGNLLEKNSIFAHPTSANLPPTPEQEGSRLSVRSALDSSAAIA